MSSTKQRRIEDLPNAISSFDSILQRVKNEKPFLFLDYDGTLSPIVSNPAEAVLSAKTKDVIMQIAGRIPVAVVSGRDRADVEARVGLQNLIYAGSHGFDIVGLDYELELQYEAGVTALPVLDEVEKKLRLQLKEISGVRVDRKKYAIAVHYRNIAEEHVELVKNIVFDELRQENKLKASGGKKIIEIKPAVDWHKGRAVNWILEALNASYGAFVPVFLGDDITDEDALQVVENSGIGIVVEDHGERTYASYSLSNTEEVHLFLEKLNQHLTENE